MQMQDVILQYSKFAKSKNNYGNYDVVKFNNKYYCGTNLFKYFTSFIANDWPLPVLALENELDAYNHFNNVMF